MSSKSVGDLKTLRDKTHDVYTALFNLKRPVNLWEDLIFFTVTKLDKITRHDWEISLGDSIELPNFAELDGFLTLRIRALEAISPHNSAVSKSEYKRISKSNVKSHQVSASNDQYITYDGNHTINNCKSFFNLSINQRFALVKRNKCCFNCLRKGHMLDACKSQNVCTLGL